MDITDIGAAMALLSNAAQAANAAAAAANAAAAAATAAAEAAAAAAEAANTAAANYSNLDKDAVIDRTAFNYAYMLIQAEQRDVQQRLATAEAQLDALT